MQDAKRIAIIGISGSGKSVLSRTLHKKTGLPLFHMDQLFWRGSWEAIPEEEYLSRHKEIIAGEKWLIEGYIEGKMANRLRRADLILYLDYPGSLCVWRVIQRWMMHRKESRPELPKEALEKLDYRFLWIVFRRFERPGIENAIVAAGNPSALRFRSPRQLKDFLTAQNI